MSLVAWWFHLLIRRYLDALKGVTGSEAKIVALVGDLKSALDTTKAELDNIKPGTAKRQSPDEIASLVAAILKVFVLRSLSMVYH